MLTLMPTSRLAATSFRQIHRHAPRHARTPRDRSHQRQGTSRASSFVLLYIAISAVAPFVLPFKTSMCVQHADADAAATPLSQ